MEESEQAVSRSAQSSWRGIMLSRQQETILIQYFSSETPGISFAKHGKHFWVKASKACPVLIGRPYSWQSCRRCALAWERKSKSTEGRFDDSETDPRSLGSFDSQQTTRQVASESTSDAPRESSEGRSSPQTPQPKVENSGEEDDEHDSNDNGDSEDDMLPEQLTPLLNRRHNLLATKMSPTQINDMASSLLTKWENEVKNISGILEENQNPAHQQRILRAFSVLKNEMQESIQRYNDRIGGSP